jgi:hypothetical protein
MNFNDHLIKSNKIIPEVIRQGNHLTFRNNVDKKIFLGMEEKT